MGRGILYWNYTNQYELWMELLHFQLYIGRFRSFKTRYDVRTAKSWYLSRRMDDCTISTWRTVKCGSKVITTVVVFSSQVNRNSSTFKYHVFAPMGTFQLELIYFPPSFHLTVFFFLSCKPFVVNTTFSTGLVGVEVTSVSWLGQKNNNYNNQWFKLQLSTV